MGAGGCLVFGVCGGEEMLFGAEGVKGEGGMFWGFMCLGGRSGVW